MTHSTLSNITPAKTFRPTYVALLERALRYGFRELNERTGAGILALPPVSFTLDLSDRLLPVCGIRKTFPKSAAAEVAWFLMGTQDVSWLRQHAPLWDKFTEADGKTIEAAYGHRWMVAFGRNQIEEAVEALREDRSNRRVYVSNWDPRYDGLLSRGQKNVPCPLGFTLSILDGALNSSLTLRSSDIFVGLPYDVMGHALLMQAIALSLGVQLGTMQVNLAHPHLYEVHEQEAWLALTDVPSDDTIAMPAWGLGSIIDDPDGYVELVKGRQAKMQQPKFHTRPEVVV